MGQHKVVVVIEPKQVAITPGKFIIKFIDMITKVHCMFEQSGTFKNGYGESFKVTKAVKTIQDAAKGKGGLCSEERSMISREYAKNFICDFILGRENENTQARLF